MGQGDPDAAYINWEKYIPTDAGAGWDGERSHPPLDSAYEEWERWRLVREAVRYNNGLCMSVDRVRQIQRRVRPDEQMTSTRGEFDPLTVIALMWFQRDEGMRITGIIDADTSAALARRWKELGYASVRRLQSARTLLRDDAPALHRFLFYRSAIHQHGGLFDDGHRMVNVLMLRDAELRLGTLGYEVWFVGTTGRDGTTPWVTVSMWLERDGGDDDGEVTGVAVRERPGHARPLSLRRTTKRELGTGQFVCDLEGGHPIPSAQGILRQYDTSVGAIPVHVARVPRAPRVRRPWVDPNAGRLVHGHFFAELEAMRTERARRDGWHGVRVMMLDASKLEPAT